MRTVSLSVAGHKVKHKADIMIAVLFDCGSCRCMMLEVQQTRSWLGSKLEAKDILNLSKQTVSSNVKNQHVAHTLATIV